MELGISYIRETLAATDEGTFMWLVTGVGSTVNCQSRALNEGLVARLVIASVGSFIRMYSIMPLEIGLSIEAL